MGMLGGSAGTFYLESTHSMSRPHFWVPSRAKPNQPHSQRGYCVAPAKYLMFVVAWTPAGPHSRWLFCV